MTEYLTAAMVHGNGYNPKDVPEDIKVSARKLVIHVYADSYTPGYLRRIEAGRCDYDKEVEVAVKALMAERVSATERERERCAKIAEDEDGRFWWSGTMCYFEL